MIAGSLIADVFYTVDTYPDQGMLTKIRDNDWNIGGTGNIILDLAKLDSSLPIYVSAIVGDDDNGRMLEKTLKAYPNIRLDHLRRDGQTSITIVMNAEDTKQRTFFFQSGGSSLYGEEYIDWDHLDVDIFHLEYLLLLDKVDAPDPEYVTHGARILHKAQQLGMKTSVDMVSEQSDRAKRVVTAALRYTDYCAINEVEAEAVTGIPLKIDGEFCEERIQQALRAIADMGVSTWVVIHSPEMGYGYDCKTDAFVKVPSLTLPKGYIKGSTGAGDAYCSGILYGAYRGWELEQAMILGTASAACSLSEMNGTDGLRPLDDVMKLYQQLR